MVSLFSHDNSSDDRPAGERTLLVGTSLTVRQALHMLAMAQQSLDFAGCLLPHMASESGSEFVASPADAATAVPVLGGFSDLETVVAKQRIEKVLLSLPVAMAPTARGLAAALDQAAVRWRWLPALADQLAGRATILAGSALGSMSITPGSPATVDSLQLLGRRPHPLDEGAIEKTLAGRNVLITGAGGSIGSELARLACRFNPGRLVLVERSENALFEIDGELERSFPDIRRACVLHDVTDAPRTLAIIRQHKPDVIFHAAAHKHVPMMEDHPAQAVENNFFGTRSIADAAAQAGVDKFVMISTDKAVNPSSVMGATKRLAELYIQHLNTVSETTFCMVRFGNVLGSACSVLPIWTRQLEQGGPITVTHPQMTRYFMTIPEAAGLVLQSAALSGGQRDDATAGQLGAAGGPIAQGGEVFVLDMGQPVRIVDLAQRFLRAHGLEPGVDIQIEFTGIRPGEKLVEQLAYEGEDIVPTGHKAVRLWRSSAPLRQRIKQIIAAFDRLRSSRSPSGHAWQHASHEAILTALREAIPEMVPPASQASSNAA